MKRLMVGAFLAALAVGPAHADQPVKGAIIVPTPGGGVAARCAYSLGGSVTQGVTGWFLATVTPGDKFTLKADTTPSTNDFDISFYSTPAPDPCSDPNGAHVVAYANHVGDESGVIPAGSICALIRMTTGVPNTGFTFTHSS